MKFRLIESIDNNIINQLNKYYTITDELTKESFDRSFILQNGDFLICPKSNGGTSTNHYRVLNDIDELIKNGSISLNISFTDYSNNNLIRCNGEFENYILIPKNSPTNSQYFTLEDWISHFQEIKPSYYPLKVMADMGHKQVSYYIKDNEPKDIINKIRKFYQNGILNESLIEKVIKDYKPNKIGTAYKVFKVKNGKLYPPMVANPNNEDTPVGVWLEAEEGEFAGLSKTGRKQVKSIGSGTLSYRPGWHLGDIPRASQFDRTNKETGEKEFPKDFVWAECEYVMDIDYQPESDEQGYMRTKADGSEYRSDKYQHSLAGLHKLPKDGYYKYRTNPRPDTVPWVITGAIKVNKLLDDYQVNDILKEKGVEPIHRQGGDKTLKELGL